MYFDKGKNIKNFIIMRVIYLIYLLSMKRLKLWIEQLKSNS